MSLMDAIVAGFLAILAVSAILVAQRLGSPRTRDGCVRALATAPGTLRSAMLAILVGVAVIAQADAVRAYAQLDAWHGGFRAAILVGYALLATGFAAVAWRVMRAGRPA